MPVHQLEEASVAEGQRAEDARHAELAAIVRVALIRARDLRHMLHQCVAAMEQHLNVSLAQVWTLSAGGKALELQASAGFYRFADAPRARLPVGGTVFGPVANTCRTVLTHSGASEALWG